MQLTSVDGNALTSGGLVPYPVEKLRIAERWLLEVKLTGGGAAKAKSIWRQAE